MKRITLFFVLVCLSGCWGWYEVPFFSMEPTIEEGAKIKIDKNYYSSSSIKRFDIVSYLRPDNGALQVKRVIAVGGETVRLDGGYIFINDTKLIEPFSFELIRKDFKEIKVPKDHYYVLGDNRNNSSDSRYWGALHESLIIGKVVEIKNP